MPREKPEYSPQKSVHQALRAWRDFQSNENFLDEFLLIRKRRQSQHGVENAATLRVITNEVLLEGVEELEKLDSLGAKILRERFMNDQSALSVSFKLHLSIDQLNRLQRKAINALTDILQDRDQYLRQDEIKRLEAQLPSSPYTQLFGVQEFCHTVKKLLRQASAPWLISITGLGGIGKTSFADAVVRQIIQELIFEQVIWLRAETPSLSEMNALPSRTIDDLNNQLAAQLFPEGGNPANRSNRIREVLKEMPHLIVIDNLETEADTQYIFTRWAEWVDPSKILITNRTNPPTQAGVFTLSLSELPVSDALDLIRHHAQIIGLSDLATASDEALEPILHAVGGNPFALKLVVGLAKTLPMDEILKDLPVGHASQIEQMYKYIYWKIWHTLNEPARTLLQVMPLVANVGAKPEQLEAISGLPSNDLLDAIQELATRSLLEIRGTVWDRRYGIHRLTDSFLRTEIIHWPEEKA